MKADRLRWVLGLGLVAIALAAGGINLSEAAAAGLGPEGLAQFSQGTSEPMRNLRKQLEPHLAAMGHGVYRWGLLVQAVVGALAAVGLLLGGLALLAGSRTWRAWVLAWVFYAILMSPLTAILSAIYLIPEVAQQQGHAMTTTGQVIQGVMIAVMQCIFPMALLMLLRLPALRGDSLTAHVARPIDRDPTADPPSRPPSPASANGLPSDLAARPTSSSAPSASTALRDDPWNDPSAT